MRTSARGAAFIAAHEGIVTRAYRDVAGVWTIGVGHTAAAGVPKPVKGMTITRDQAMAILAADLPRYERRVARAFAGLAIPQHIFDAAVSFDFNTGAIHKASWVKHWRAGDLAKARSALMLWNKAGGRVVRGLVNRREAEAKLIFEGDYGKGLFASLSGVPPSAPLGSAGEQGTDNDYRRKLAMLGFASVFVYQQNHPDLANDGVLGPATRAQIDRDLAAREGAAGAAAGGVGIAVSGGVAAAIGGLPHVATVAGVVGVAVLILGGGFVLWRYGGEIVRMFRRVVIPAKAGNQ